MNLNPPQKKTVSQKVYAGKSRQKDEFQKLVNEAAQASAKRLKEKNPAYAGLDIKCMNLAYVKGQKGISKAYIEIASAIMEPENMKKTQREILEQVQLKFPALTLHQNIWNRELIPNMKKQIDRKIQNNMMKPVSLVGCNTLAAIRKKVKTALKVSKDGKTFKATVTFTPDAVVIGKTSYAISKKEAADKKYAYSTIRVDIKGKGRCSIRVDGLRAALQNS